MREVILATSVRSRLDDLEAFLKDELKLSKEAAAKRMDRIGDRLNSLSVSDDYALCRFRVWRDKGYRCLAFEGWVFAYEVVPQGVIVRDTNRGKLLSDVD